MSCEHIFTPKITKLTEYGNLIKSRPQRHHRRASAAPICSDATLGRRPPAPGPPNASVTVTVRRLRVRGTHGDGPSDERDTSPETRKHALYETQSVAARVTRRRTHTTSLHIPRRINRRPLRLYMLYSVRASTRQPVARASRPRTSPRPPRPTSRTYPRAARIGGLDSALDGANTRRMARDRACDAPQQLTSERAWQR